MTESLHTEFGAFRAIVASYRAEANEQDLRIGAVLGVGLLMGGGFPASAAALAVLAERQYPSVDFPWSAHDREGAKTPGG